MLQVIPVIMGRCHFVPRQVPRGVCMAGSEVKGWGRQPPRGFPSQRDLTSASASDALIYQQGTGGVHMTQRDPWIYIYFKP